MPRDENPLEQLARIFAALGRTPDHVAEALRAGGCRGFRFGYFPSPVVRYAYRWFDDGQLVMCHSAPRTWGKLYLYRLDRSREEMPLPGPVAEFLDLFDMGAYPDLDLELNGTRA
jgi:hypothetical protein